MTGLLETSSLFKVFECFSVFVALVIHRIGNRGSQVWFGTIDFEMNYKSVPTETDAEIVGCGILSCMAIVTPLILISYLWEGRDVVQSTVMDIAFSFIAAALLMCAGGMACFTYNSVFALSGPPVVANIRMKRRELRAAASMGVTCLGASLIYIADFFWCLMQRSKFLNEY
ncbi:uncharacterized protein LOC111714021 [Eurytemora carolleeae]|uniref:uncharacterized protein LOC111714021 n=1 Tax=Eurytemora carolleeae TaxID=1294199 RepID=UPI000C785C09|nr:uncharacterized protein LOC111714021 [Eurytemora carolleeae]|eukprot:XP_023344791.1 uncharacterized protein LOC111714021 [Eurytemora affinis]